MKQLEYFLAVADSGAISRAAILLSVGQRVLSRQIKALEEELGAELYHRTGRGIILTDAGRILADHARNIVERTERARSEIQDLGAAPAWHAAPRPLPGATARRAARLHAGVSRCAHDVRTGQSIPDLRA
jgi:DNA-binding transcriptional LysR family regulator